MEVSRPSDAIGLRHARTAEVFLRKNVGRNLAPVSRHFHFFHLLLDFPVWVADDGSTQVILKHVVRRHAFLGEVALKG